MVAQGWAVAYRKYSTDYVSQETAAKAARRGLWRGDFVEPSRWRRGERLEAAAAGGAGDCRIKGNISRKGTRIYHVPSGAPYAKTRVDPAKGERWFCTEAEAGAAAGEAVSARAALAPKLAHLRVRVRVFAEPNASARIWCKPVGERRQRFPVKGFAHDDPSAAHYCHGTGRS